MNKFVTKSLTAYQVDDTVQVVTFLKIYLTELSVQFNDINLILKWFLVCYQNNATKIF